MRHLSLFDQRHLLHDNESFPIGAHCINPVEIHSACVARHVDNLAVGFCAHLAQVKLLHSLAKDIEDGQLHGRVLLEIKCDRRSWIEGVRIVLEK